MCRDEAPFTDPERLAEAQAVPVFGPTLGRHGDLDACEVWDVEPAPPAANEPVHSDVPFLVLAGALDTVSSPEWADAFADGLDTAHIVHLPGVGTQPTSGYPSTAQDCALELRTAFLADPNAELDDSCVATAHGPAFTLP